MSRLNHKIFAVLNFIAEVYTSIQKKKRTSSEHNFG
jgi:hypothetical protein